MLEVEDASSERSSSFNLSEALDDLVKIEDGEEPLVPEVRPLDEMIELLLGLNIPTKERVEIIRNLQVRDNWLQYFGKHFTKVLTGIKKKERAHDDRIKQLQKVLHEAQIPSTGGGTVSRKRNHHPTEQESSSRLSLSKRQSYLEMMHPSQSEEHHPPPPNRPAYPYFKIHSEIAEVSSSSAPPPPYQPNPLSVIGSSPETTDRQKETGSSSTSSCPTTDDDDHGGQSSPKKKQAEYSFAVRTVVSTSIAKPNQGFCIMLVATQLGKDPQPTSGLVHFSKSCKRRAELKAHHTSAAAAIAAAPACS